MRLHVSPSRRRGAVAVAAGVVAALGLAACSGGGGGADPEAGGATGEVDQDAVIKAGISYALSGGFDPMTTTGAVTVAANWHVFEGLTEIDPATREVYAALGADMPEEIDETHYEVDLRDGAVFHDGSPVTTDDVVYSFERVMDPDNESIYADFIDFVDSVSAVDEDTVSIELKHPFSLVAERLSTVKVVPQELVESDYDAFNALPVGTGPYELTAATPGESITFERFDDYTGSRPAQAAGLEWDLLADPAARVTAQSSGTVSAIEDVPYIDVPSLESQATVESVQSFGLLFMMFNTDEEPFDDPRVRQAFFYALDMDKIIETGMLGNAEAATSFLPKDHPNYHEASTVYTYDPEKAQQLLADAGVENLSVDLSTTDTGWVGDVAPLIKEDLEAVGVTTSLDVGQSAGQYAKVDEGNFDVMVAPGDPSVFGNDPDLLMRWWFGDNVWSERRYRWADDPRFAELQKLLDAGVQADGDEQQEQWNQAFDLISDEVPLYPLFHRKLPTAWDGDQLSGFQPLPVTGLSFLDVGSVGQ